jgi:saccharopine dehydrogenase-like NADP-dependent oxidoreductase
MKTVLVIGAGGYFGRLLVEELLQFCQCRIILAQRNVNALQTMRQSWTDAWKERTEVEPVDLNDRTNLDSVVACSHIAVCSAGPFQDLSNGLLDACLANNVNYIDLSDDRLFVLNSMAICNQFATRTPPVVASGWSAVPALGALLARLASDEMERIERIRIQIAPGNRAPRGYATVASLLDSLGKQFTIWRDHEWVTVTGWSEPVEFAFPQPVGRRIGSLVDVPDLTLFPSLFDASTVEFRVGAEFRLFNYACTVLAQMRKRGMVKSWKSQAESMQKLMSLFGSLGHDSGAVGVECKGTSKGKTVTQKACIIADNSGHHIPVMAASVLCEKLLREEKQFHGLPPLADWLTREELETECKRRGYRLIVESTSTSAKREIDS